MTSTLPSLADIRASVPPEKRFNSYWCRFFLRQLSFPITWVFIRLGFSANQVSYLSVLVALLAAILMWTHARPLVMLGAALFNFWAVLDCVDGNVARVRREVTKYGDFTDALPGYVVYAFVFLAAGVAAEHSRGLAPDFLRRLDFVFVAALASIFNLTMRLVYQQFRNVSGQRTMRQGTFAGYVGSNLGITGLLMPAVLGGVIFNQLHWVIMFYAVFHSAAFVVVCIRLVMKAEALRKQELCH